MLQEGKHGSPVQVAVLQAPVHEDEGRPLPGNPARNFGAVTGDGAWMRSSFIHNSLIRPRGPAIRWVVRTLVRSTFARAYGPVKGSWTS